MPTPSASPPSPRGLALPLARLAWWPLALAMTGLTLLALPGYLQAVRAQTFLEVPRAALSAGGLLLNLLGAGLSLGAALLSLTLAALLFWRRADDRMALFVSAFLLLYAVLMCGPLENLTWLWPGAMAWAFSTAQPLFFTAPVISLAVLFPNGRLAPRWTRLLVGASFAVAALGLVLPPNWVQGRQTPAVIVFEAGLVACALAALYAQIYRYRYLSTPAERRQVRWVTYGLCVWGGLLLFVGGPWLFLMSRPAGAAVPAWAPWLGVGWNVALGVLPVSLTVAVLRYRLYAIDRVIRRTLIYSALTGLLALIYFSAVALLQVLLRGVSGQSSPLAIVLSTLAIAVLFAPLRGWVQRFIDRRLYRTHYDMVRTLSEFGAVLGADTEADLGRLVDQLETVVDATMQPETLWLWLAPLPDPNRLPHTPSGSSPR